MKDVAEVEVVAEVVEVVVVAAVAVVEEVVVVAGAVPGSEGAAEAALWEKPGAEAAGTGRTPSTRTLLVISKLGIK